MHYLLVFRLLASVLLYCTVLLGFVTLYSSRGVSESDFFIQEFDTLGLPPWGKGDGGTPRFLTSNEAI